jgi:ElaB/YqjD/DUF883 family membrane-anchored ribosome-binding protein
MENVAETGKRDRRADPSGGESGGSEEWRNLVADVEDLVKKVANVDDAEIAQIRGKVEDALAKAKGSVGDSAAELRARAGEVTDATDDYVRENPWAAVGIAAVIGLVIGLVAGRR